MNCRNPLKGSGRHGLQPGVVAAVPPSDKPTPYSPQKSDAYSPGSLYVGALATPSR